MAHYASEAGSPPVSIAEKAAAFEETLFADGDPFADEEENNSAEPEAEDDDIDELDEDDVEEEEIDGDDEQAKPAIEPPVSLNADEKAVFAQLPPEAQQAWAASETRRNQQVQEATTRAAEAQRVAEAKAAAANAQAEAVYAAQLKAVAAAFRPVEPDPAQYASIEQYRHAKAVYDHQLAQHMDFEQQVLTVGKETPEAKAARIQARDQQLLTIPEIADPATRDDFIRGCFSVAQELGYDTAELAENMDVGDLKALARVKQAFDAEAELARIRAKSQERVRNKKTGQFTAMKPGSAPHGDPRRGTAAKSFEKLKSLKGSRDNNAKARAMEDYLDKAGWL